MSKKRKKGLKKVHLQMLLVLAAYFVLGNTLLIRFSLSDDPLLFFGMPFLYGAVSAIVFLYIFSHEEFFRFAKDLKKKEMKVEKKWLKRFARLGRASTTLLIGAAGGPLLGALTARLIIRTTWHRYLLVLLANIPSTVITVGVAKGAISILG